MANNVEYIISLRDLFIKKLKEADKAADHFDGTVKKAQTSVRGMLTEVSAYIGVAKLGYDFFETAQKVDGFNSTLKFTEGSTELAARRFDYLVDKSNELGLSLESSAKGYTQIASAAKGTVLEGKATQEAFEGVSTAASVMRLSGEQTEGALLALSQIISKGKVQAEELRGQLGERIPGAFQIAARAMNMTTKELDAFMSEGKLLAEDFIPRFSQQLLREFGQNVPSATESLAVATNNLRTEYFLFMKDIYDGVKPAVISVALAFKELLGYGRDVVKWLKENSSEVKAAAVFIGTMAAGLLYYNSYVATTIFLTKAWTVAQAILNGTMMLNPIGLITAAVAALAAGIYYLWENSETFRATLYGIWGVIKEVSGPLFSFAKALASLFLDPANAIKNFKSAIEDFKNMDIKLAFEAAYERGKMSMDKRRTDGKEGNRYYPEGEGATAGSSVTPSFSTDNGKSSGKVSSVKPTTINITIDSLVKEFKIETKNIQESTARIKEVVVRTLMESVNDSQRLAGN